MKLFIYSIKDTATQSFGTPMFMMAKGQMMRSFSDEVNRISSDNQLNRHPTDFELYLIGEFDTDTGIIMMMGPEFIIRAVDLINTDSSNVVPMREAN